MGFLLNKVADILLLILWFFCNVVGTIFAIRDKEYNEWNKNKALAKDAYGNVLIKYVGNFFLITKASQHKFGNPKEYISYVIGMNKYAGTLTYLGSVVDGILEFFDPGHSLNAAGFGTRKIAIQKYWYLSKMFYLKLSIALVFVFGIILQFPGCEWAIWPIFAAFAYCAVFGAIMIVYAFLINPINNLKAKYV